MIRIIRSTLAIPLILLLASFSYVPIAHAQSGDLGLCPNGYTQGLVTTGFVECHRESSRRSTREEAELLRLQREAVCNAHPNSQITSSEIIGTSSGGFFARLICTVTRDIPEGTTLCPDNSEEVYRAFDTLVCQNFGSSFDTTEEAQTELDSQIADCTAAPGNSVLQTELSEEMFDGLTFYTASLACAFSTAATDTIECPFGFRETNRDENTIECEVNDREIETLAEAQEINLANQSICTDTTAGLATVNEQSMAGESSNSEFFSLVVCDIKIPSYGDFTDQNIIRACDASCTEEVEQVRVCLNGGIIGGPGCIEESTQMIVRRCNTGTQAGGLCQLVITPTVVPILLLDDDD
jgi:hypothetical protein